MHSVPFQTIMVGVDMAKVSQPAFERALTLAQMLKAKLLIAHVMSSTDPDRPQLTYNYAALGTTIISTGFHDLYDQEWTAYTQHYEALLAEKIQAATAAGVHAESIQSYGASGPILCELARQQQVDLLVVGSHRRRGLSELLVGSTSNYITHHAPCAVLVVGPTIAKQAPSAAVCVTPETASV